MKPNLETRKLMLDLKAQTLQKELGAWASENEILGPGEQIVFSLRIEGVPLVVRGTASGEITVRDFFSTEHLRKHNVPNSLIGRISHCMLQGGWGGVSMQEFVSKWDKPKLLRVPNLGRKSVNEILRVAEVLRIPIRK